MSDKPLVSVIVPTRNSHGTIGDCLKSIRNQSYKNIEIILVDNNSSDKTTEIARKYTKLIFNKGPERSSQRNYGAFKSKGKFVLFIDSDMELTKDVVKECVESIKGHKALIIPEQSFGESFWARCKALERSFYLGVDWIEAARFFNRGIFIELNGFDKNLISGEDWDLSQRVAKKYKLGRIYSFIRHNEGKLSLIHLISKKFYYARNIKKYSSKSNNVSFFKRQFSPLERYKLFLSQPTKLFANPVLGLGMLFMKTMEFFFGGVARLLR